MSYNVKIVGADRFVNGANGLPGLTSGQIIPGPARLYSVTIFNTGPTQYYQIFDLANTPANATPCMMQIKVPADSQGSFDFQDGRQMVRGICVLNSTTSATLTQGAQDSLIDVTYRQTS